MWVVSDKMEDEYIVREPFKLSLAVRVAVPIVSFAAAVYAVLLNLVVGWNYESMDRQVELAEKLERGIGEAESRCVVDDSDLDEIIGSYDGN